MPGLIIVSNKYTLIYISDVSKCIKKVSSQYLDANINSGINKDP